MSQLGLVLTRSLLVGEGDGKEGKWGCQEWLGWADREVESQGAVGRQPMVCLGAGGNGGQAARGLPGCGWGAVGRQPMVFLGARGSSGQAARGLPECGGAAVGRQPAACWGVLSLFLAPPTELKEVTAGLNPRQSRLHSRFAVPGKLGLLEVA